MRWPTLSFWVATGLACSLLMPLVVAKVATAIPIQEQSQTVTQLKSNALESGGQPLGEAHPSSRQASIKSIPDSGFWPTPVFVAQANPTAGVLTSVSHDGGEVTLRGRAQRGSLMNNAADKLSVPARSRANIGFRNAAGNNIPNFLMQAGSSLRLSEYWYPCRGQRGRFIIGWSAGGGSSCAQVQLGQTRRISTRTNRNLGVSKQPTLVSALAPELSKANFPDTQGHWAEAEIDALNNQGILSGYYEDGTFRPNAPVTRAEFAAMVNKAFGTRSTVRSEQDFPDTAFHWASAAVRKAYALGFISGYPEGDFRPEGNIIRAEAIVALASGLNLQGDLSLDGLYSDSTQICGEGAPFYWACTKISAAASNGIRIQGPNPDQFNPNQQASRADIASFIYQALQGRQTPGSPGNEVTQPPVNGGVETNREPAPPNPENEAEVVVEPVNSEIAWILADVTDDKVEVTVLGGTVEINSGTTPQQVSAGERYTLEQNQVSGNVTPLSPEERVAIVSSPEVTAFLDANNWSPEMSTQLSYYQSEQIDLLAGISKPKLEIVGIEITPLEQTSPRGGRIRIVGTIVNQGGPLISTPGTQWAILGETPQITDGEQPVEVARQEFQNLAPGESVRVVYERDWDNSIYDPADSTAIVPRYWLYIDYDSNVDSDSNPHNDIFVGWLSSPASEATCFFGGCPTR